MKWKLSVAQEVDDEPIFWMGNWGTEMPYHRLQNWSAAQSRLEAGTGWNGIYMAAQNMSTEWQEQCWSIATPWVPSCSGTCITDGHLKLRLKLADTFVLECQTQEISMRSDYLQQHPQIQECRLCRNYTECISINAIETWETKLKTT